MTIAQRVGMLEKNMELARQSGEFVSLCRVLLQSKGDIYVARQIAAERGRVTPRVKELLDSNDVLTIIRKGNPGARTNPSDAFMNVKAATAALPLGMAGPFSTFALLVAGFVNSLQSIGVFDGMRSSMRAVPVGSVVGAVTTSAAGFVVGEGSAKQVSKLSLTNGTLDPQKAHAIVAVSSELLRFGGRDVDALIQRELINAAVLAIDGSFLTTLLAGVSIGTSTGSTAVSAWNDLANLLLQVPTDQTSKLFIITTPAVCKAWAAMGATATNGSPAFDGMTPQGGTILGIPVIASDAPAAGQVILVDASGIAAGSDAVVLSTMSEGTIMPDTTPNSPQVAGTNVVSLWQSNLSALVVERWWGAERLRANAVAAVSNANSYGQGFSPP